MANITKATKVRRAYHFTADDYMNAPITGTVKNVRRNTAEFNSDVALCQELQRQAADPVCNIYFRMSHCDQGMNMVAGLLNHNGGRATRDELQRAGNFFTATLNRLNRRVIHIALRTGRG